MQDTQLERIGLRRLSVTRTGPMEFTDPHVDKEGVIKAIVPSAEETVTNVVKQPMLDEEELRALVQRTGELGISINWHFESKRRRYTTVISGRRFTVEESIYDAVYRHSSGDEEIDESPQREEDIPVVTPPAAEVTKGGLSEVRSGRRERLIKPSNKKRK